MWCGVMARPPKSFWVGAKVFAQLFCLFEICRCKFKMQLTPSRGIGLRVEMFLAP
jgi:hypothetical protein